MLAYGTSVLCSSLRCNSRLTIIIIVCTTRRTNQIDHDLDHLDLTFRCEVLCRICIVQIQPRKHALGNADYMAPTRQHELEIIPGTDQESICPQRSRS